MDSGKAGGQNPSMLRLLGLVVSIGLADSLNPTTIAPALYLATGRHARRDVAEFTASVFVVYLLGGLIILLGPGQLLLALVPHPGRHLSYVLEIIAGVSMVTAAAFLWSYRDRLGRPRERKRFNPRGRSSAVLGATITAVELPTAFPYFAAIAAIVGAGIGPSRSVVLLLIFNLCFVLPLIGIVVVLTVAGSRAERFLAPGRAFMERRWPHILAILVGVVGVLAMLLGATGLAAQGHGGVGRFFLHVREATFDRATQGQKTQAFASTATLFELMQRTDVGRMNALAVTFHMRLTRPIVGMLLVIMGLSIILRDQTRHVFISAGLCLAMCAVFFAAVFGGKFLGTGDYVSPALAAWLPVLIFAPLSFALYDAIHT